MNTVEPNKPDFVVRIAHGLVELFYKAGKDKALAVVLMIILAPYATTYFSANEEEKEASKKVFKAFIAAKNHYSGLTSRCLSGEKITKEMQDRRIDLRYDLVTAAVENKRYIPSSVYFSISKFTRFDDTTHLQNLCVLSKLEINEVKNKLTPLQNIIEHDLNL